MVYVTVPLTPAGPPQTGNEQMDKGFMFALSLPMIAYAYPFYIEAQIEQTEWTDRTQADAYLMKDPASPVGFEYPVFADTNDAFTTIRVTVGAGNFGGFSPPFPYFGLLSGGNAWTRERVIFRGASITYENGASEGDAGTIEFTKALVGVNGDALANYAFPVTVHHGDASSETSAFLVSWDGTIDPLRMSVPTGPVTFSEDTDHLPRVLGGRRVKWGPPKFDPPGLTVVNEGEVSVTVTNTVRFLGGMWSTRQRQNPAGNSGGWPLRQRQNGGATGSWPLRQRQSGQ